MMSETISPLREETPLIIGRGIRNHNF